MRRSTTLAAVGSEVWCKVLLAAGRQQRHHAVGLQPAALDQALQQALAVAEDAHRLGLSFSPDQFTGSQPGVG
jgi:hypothetical protein